MAFCCGQNIALDLYKEKTIYKPSPIEDNMKLYTNNLYITPKVLSNIGVC